MAIYGYEKNILASNVNPRTYKLNIENLKWELHKMGKDEDWAYKVPIPMDHLMELNELHHIIYNIDAVRSCDPFTFARSQEEDMAKARLKKQIKEMEEERKHQEYLDTYSYGSDTDNINYSNRHYGPPAEESWLVKIVGILFVLGLWGIMIYFFITDYCGYKLF